MINLKFNFTHPFSGKVQIRKRCTGRLHCRQVHFDSEGQNNFEIPLDVEEDGQYRVILEWEYENRNFSYESDILIKGKKLVTGFGIYETN